MITRVFQSGNSQAVRIPLAFRFDVDTVEIFREENGDIVLRPISLESEQKDNKGEKILALFNGFDDDFIQALEDRINETEQERDEL